MAYSLSPSTCAVKVAPNIALTDTKYIQTFTATDLDNTAGGRPATPAIDCSGLANFGFWIQNSGPAGAESFATVYIYGGNVLDSSGNISTPQDLNTTTFFGATQTINTLAPNSATASCSYVANKLNALPKYIQLYIVTAAAASGVTNSSVTIIGEYLAG